jgi:hypothetical protein
MRSGPGPFAGSPDQTAYGRPANVTLLPLRFDIIGQVPVAVGSIVGAVPPMTAPLLPPLELPLLLPLAPPLLLPLVLPLLPPLALPLLPPLALPLPDPLLLPPTAPLPPPRPLELPPLEAVAPLEALPLAWPNAASASGAGLEPTPLRAPVPHAKTKAVRPSVRGKTPWRGRS